MAHQYMLSADGYRGLCRKEGLFVFSGFLSTCFHGAQQPAMPGTPVPSDDQHLPPRQVLLALQRAVFQQIPSSNTLPRTVSQAFHPEESFLAISLATYCSGLHHPMGRGHGHNLSTAGKEFLFQVWFSSWSSASVLRDRGSSLDVFFHYSLECFCW